MKSRKSLFDFLTAAMVLNHAEFLLGARLMPSDSKARVERTSSSSSSSSSPSANNAVVASASALIPPSLKTFYANGNAEDDLPLCSSYAVCNKVDTYSRPWIEKQCRCGPGFDACSSSPTPSDGRTITDRTRQLKICEPISELPKCKYFHDITWSYLVTTANGSLEDPSGIREQKTIVNCICPKHSVAYIVKKHAYFLKPDTAGSPGGVAYQFSFACSPKTEMKCEKKQPCRLFSVKRRGDVDDVTASTLCRCQRGLTCPRHHTDAGIVADKVFKSYKRDTVRIFSAYCVP